jgi:hypothetical protein
MKPAPRHLWWAMTAAAALMAAACATPKLTSPPPPAPPVLDASYDWHVLLVAPFGSVLKDIPMSLHEVLVFRDEERAGASADDSECYAVNGAAPHFIARSPSLYMLCFKHERLARIEATVRLPDGQAQQIFADACALWTKNARSPESQGCEGADAGIVFAAHMERAPDETDQQLIIQLDAADPASDHAAEAAPDRAPDR